MTTSTAVAESVIREFEAAWRDETPVFGCCRKAVAAAVEDMDLLDLATREVTDRVQTLRSALDERLPGHLETHRCCSGHVADLAFDLPGMLSSAQIEEGARA